MYPEALKRQLANIKLIVLDVDGVLTDGAMVYGASGIELKNFNSHDGQGIMMAREAGLKCAILTAKVSKAVKRRAEDLKFDFYESGHSYKIDALASIMGKAEVSKDEVLYMGDDLPDLACKPKVAVFAAPASAVARVQKDADWLVTKSGGKGAVREMIDGLLAAQDKLELVETYFLQDRANG